MISNPSYQNFATFDKSEYPHLWNGVVGAWCPSLGPTGTRVHDMSRRSNWGTLTNMDNATDWVVSDGQYALDFDGSNDYVLITDGRFPTLGVSAVFSASIWFRVASVPAGRREIMPTPAIAPGLFGAQLEIDGGKLRIRADNAGAASYTFADPLDVPTGRWVHAAGTWDGRVKIATLYKDGKSIGTADYSANTANNVTATRWLFGALEYANVVYFYYPGLIAEATLYSRVLSPNEIQQLHQIGPGGMYQRRRRTRKVSVQVGNAIWLKTGGVWKETTPWIKVGGTWKTATPNIKVSGTWK